MSVEVPDWGALFPCWPTVDCIVFEMSGVSVEAVLFGSGGLEALD